MLLFSPLYLTVGDLLDGSVLRDVDVQSVWVVIHGHHVALADDTVLLGEVFLCKSLPKKKEAMSAA